MVSEVVMPQMGADMTEGTLLRWLKEEGDSVARGDVIAEIETDKANIEIEAFESGVFRKALAQEGDVVQVGDVIAVIAGAGDDISKYDGARSGAAAAATGGATKVDAPPAAAVREAQPAMAAQPVATNGRTKASPLAKRIAEERGVDLRGVHGSGPGGRIVKRDVESAAASAAAIARPSAAKQAVPAAPAPAAVRPGTPAAASGAIEMSRMRQAIARRMSQSKREAPHYYLLVDIDMTEAMALRKQINAAAGEEQRVSVNDLIVRACAMALQRHPEFNVTAGAGTGDGESFAQQAQQNVCIAIALDDGLIAPAIMDAGSKRLTEIAAETRDLVERAKGGALRAEEVTQGTFTITNLGAYGIETLVGIIQPPQTAILGVGTVLDQAAVRDGEIVARQVMKVALSADHRVTDGAQGARFLGTIKGLLEQPVGLLL